MVNEISANKASNTYLSTKSQNLEIKRTSTVLKQDGSQTSTTESVSFGSKSSSALTYNGTMQLQDMAEAGYDKLRAWVANLLQEQGLNTKISMGETEVNLETIEPEQAQELISEDGYFGVEKTSERIFQFAIGIAGGDTSRIEAIKEGIDQGFAAAKEAFGDWLPDISYDTYDAVMEKLDNWVAQSETEA
ncbi:hypothetical protein JWJ90_19750 [Desulfobulbus rhabdoformis]|uniref:hypothetical protein n=1 Tax=Desulfobulbus rhabdoformis TaxID=34032 RepID=UPI0019666641|nr:hypothetical protein [Desulfobulbus rhabdoformis]MBM9616504.1 hypothetical protein [Desulfobulbus rhabdoformis]